MSGGASVEETLELWASSLRGIKERIRPLGQHCLDYGRTGRCSAPLGIRVFWLVFPLGVWRVATDHRSSPGALLRF